jgi:hypothetical protein
MLLFVVIQKQKVGAEMLLSCINSINHKQKADEILHLRIFA